MFKEARVGNRVWSSVHDWGTINSIKYLEKYPIYVKFDNGQCCSFTLNGKKLEEDVFPSLFWDEIKFEIPEKPFSAEDELRKLEVKEFVKNTNNCLLTWDYDKDKVDYVRVEHIEFPMSICFDWDSVIKITSILNKHKITKEQFFEAYRNVFGGKE